MTLETYKAYSSYSPAEHRVKIEANIEALKQTKQYFVDFYKEQKVEEDKRNAEFNQRSIESVPAMATAEESLQEIASLLKAFKSNTKA